MKTLSITALLATIVFAGNAHALTPIYPTQGYQPPAPTYPLNATCTGRTYATYPTKPIYKPTSPYVPTQGPSGPRPVIQTGGQPWGQPPVTQTGGNPWGQPPVTRNAGVPQQLQGIWFDISPEGNLWAYVIRANNYDMFEIDPRTNQQVVINGQPVQVDNGALTFVNGVLHLSPGAEVEEGPFNTQATPDASQLVLQSLNGEQPRTLTRQRRI